MSDVCQSYRPRDMVCRDGFIQTLACYGARCFSCGKWNAGKKPPNCMREDLPARWLTDDGQPLFHEQKGRRP
jgi:hypothetical protein